MGKINGKVILFVIWLLVISLLVYSRFVNLDWGLPYPMHPDERNMANAIQQLSCKFPITNYQFPINFQFSINNFLNCFNPHFFAYGQFPLYLGYLITYLLKFFDGDMGFPISFQEATISLRIISAIASVINVLVLMKIILLISKVKDQRSNPSLKFKTFNFTLGFTLCTLIFIFSPYAIQFAHFGTTESLLMLFYSLIIYLSMRLLERCTSNTVLWLALASGLAIATKVSSAIFLIVPLVVLISKIKDQRSNPSSKFKAFNFTLGFTLCTLIFALVFSPHNFINFKDFINSMNYESEVALGKSVFFYTRQFTNTSPFYFQLTKIFPYALGWLTFIFGLLGIIGLSWKDKKINLLRFAFLIYFIPSSLIYTKWSRFMAPVFPLMLIFATLTILNIKYQISKLSSKFKVLHFALSFALCILVFVMIVPGLAYLSVYQNSNVRFQASEWIYKNIPNNAYILSETANGVDIPMIDQKSNIKDQKAIEKFYQIISFNFYDLDESPSLQIELKNYIKKADYIFIPSRRIFANHSKEKYPILNKYYEDLFSGKLGFKEVAEFESYPAINFSFFTFHYSFKFPDEQAEETWTVFDHPVIRIYKRVAQNPKS
jgi:hypothetical protein